MNADPLVGVGLAIASGVCMAVNVLAYRFGQARGLDARHIGLHLSLIAGGFFALLAGPAWATAPASVVVMGLVCGALQYGNVRLLGAALARGPLSPLTCALFLGFTVVVAYSCLRFGERLSALQSLGLALAVLSVLLGALQGGAGGAPRPGARLRYGLILAAVFIINPAVNLAIKHLAMTTLPDGVPVLARYGSVLFACLYAGIALPLVAEWLSARPTGTALRAAAPFGALAALGAVLGLSALRGCAGLPAASVFACSAMATILVGALVSVAWFGEARSRPWWLMMGSSLAASAAFGADALIARP